MNAALGPVSRALEEDLRAYVVRGGIVVWLDADCTNTGLVERLIALRAAHQLPYEVRVPVMLASFYLGYQAMFASKS